MLIRLLVLACTLFLSTSAYGEIVLTGGWNAVGDGSGTAYGLSQLDCDSSDPSVTLGITSTSSVFGNGRFSDQKTGGQNLSLPLGGYVLLAGYNGTVSSSLDLSSGSAMVRSFIGATAAGLSTGRGSYDLFGSADILTEGYMYGAGTGDSHASGSAIYGVTRSGTPSQVWGLASGTSDLKMQSLSADSLVSTGGSPNGMHTDSRMWQNIDKAVVSSSNSRINAYASSIGRGKVNVSSSGLAQGGAWGPDFTGVKAFLSNENVASSASGTMQGYVESNGAGDSADASAIVQSSANTELNNFTISGGPACYTSGTQSSSSPRTYASTIITDAIWGSVIRQNSSRQLVQWGNLSDLISNVTVKDANSSAMTFGRILLNTDLLSTGILVKSSGNMSLETYAEATKKANATAGTHIGPSGFGSMEVRDEVMTNMAGFTSGLNHSLNHSSYIDAHATHVETHNVLESGFISANPIGHIRAIRPFNVSTASNPYEAWSRTIGTYEQSHS